MQPWDQRLARRLVKPLAGTAVTPNQVTTLSLVMGLLAAAGFATGDPVLAGWAAVAFALATLIDHADGELARLTGRTSEFGRRYDNAVSAVTKVLLFVGIGYGLRDGPLGHWAPTMGILAGISVAVIFALLNRLERAGGAAAARQPSAAGFEIEDVLYLIVPITWLGGLMPFLIAATLGAPAFALWVLWRWRRAVVRRGGGSLP